MKKKLNFEVKKSSYNSEHEKEYKISDYLSPIIAYITYLLHWAHSFHMVAEHH